VIGGVFFLMDYVHGESVGPKVIHAPELAAARAKLPAQIAEQLALIHSIDYTAYGFDFLRQPPAGRSPALDTLQGSYAMLDALGIHNPTWEFALRWAERHAPDCPQLTFIHGDVRVGNLLVDPDGLTAVIDWEFAHIGDPLEELAYPCMRDWRFGSGHLHFAGLSERETFLQAYEHYSGRNVDRAAVDWWEIMGNIRWGIICMAQAERHLSGKDPSVELASLGRRSAEMQLETLRLIDYAER
jgi:aminoglycoside phosphotransferase (APT) family kinase protein